MALLKVSCRFSNWELAAASVHQQLQYMCRAFNQTKERRSKTSQLNMHSCRLTLYLSRCLTPFRHKLNKKRNTKTHHSKLEITKLFSFQWFHQLHEFTERLHCSRRKLTQRRRMFRDLLSGRELFNQLIFILLAKFSIQTNPMFPEQGQKLFCTTNTIST